MLANNLANAGTAGFKADRESFATYMGFEAATGDARAPGVLPDLVASFVDLSQGPLLATANPLDVAIEGSGFLSAAAGDEILLTRGGQLKLSPEGLLLTAGGLPVRGEDGTPIRLDPSRPVGIDPDGTVRQGPVVAAKIALFDAPRDLLVRRADTSFRVLDPARLTRSDATLRSGYLEGANVSVPEGAIRLVSVLREFEMMQRALTLGAEMNRRATEEVARVGA